MNCDDSKSVGFSGNATNTSRFSDYWELCTVNAQISADMFARNHSAEKCIWWSSIDVKQK